MSSSVNSTGRLRVISIILPIIYFLAFGFWGFSDTDQGFIQALSWRIINGQVPYLDFIYVRPPVSPYLHTIPFYILPDQWVILGERFLFYLFISLSVFWTTRSLEVHFDFQKIGLSRELFAILAFIFSVHNFPPMAWHTVDGIFFASWGVNRITRGKTPFQYGLGLIFLFLAAMSKQAFYPLVIAGPGLLWILQGRKNALKGFLISIIPLLIILTAILFISPQWFSLMIKQTTSSSRLSDLLEVGILRYLKPFFIITLPLVFAWRFNRLYDWKYLPVSIFGLSFLGLLVLHIVKVFQTNSYIGPSYGFSQGFFLLAAGIAIKDFWLNNKASSLLLFLLLVSWCTGISWGYANNMLFFSPILFGFIYILYHELGFIVPRYFLGGICIILIWIFGTLYQYPYRDAPRSNITDSPGNYFSEFNYLYTGDEFNSKSKELFELRKTYTESFTVLPAYPLANFITHSPNPLSIDWAHNAEALYPIYKTQLEEELNQKTNYVFVQLDRLDEANDSTAYGSLLTKYVIDHWEIIETGKYFRVYQKKKDEL